MLLADAINAADDRQRRELIDMWEADSRSETQVQRAIELFRQTGAIAQSRNRIADLWHASKSAINALDLSEHRKSPLVEACARFVRDEIRVSSDWYPDRTRVRCIIRKPLLVDYK